MIKRALIERDRLQWWDHDQLKERQEEHKMQQQLKLKQTL
jgi:hypothetical protein